MYIFIFELAIFLKFLYNFSIMSYYRFIAHRTAELTVARLRITETNINIS